MRLLLITLLVCSSRVFAQDIQTLPPGDDQIVSLKLGQSAPFDGQLFSTNTAMRWGFWLEQYKLRLKIDVEAAKATCAVQVDHDAKVAAIQSAAADAIQKDLKSRLLNSEKARLAAEEEARNPPWYRSREFGIVTGVALAAGAVTLSIWALEKK